MKKTEKTFGDGDIIFREGDPSDLAFEIVAGNVEIAKTGDDGDISLAVLGPGEMFGEMGVLDQGVRSATAKAVGPVTVNAVSRKDFLAGVRDKPDLALDIMGRMAQRLRGADDRLAHGRAAAGADGRPDRAPQGSGEGGPRGDKGFLARLMGGPADAARPERIQVRVAPLSGEDAGAHTRRVVKALERRKGLRVKALKEPLTLDPAAAAGDPRGAAAAAARRALAAADSDLLIWGEVPAPGLALHLRFVSLAAWSEDAPGAFGAAQFLPLPVDFGGEFADFLHAVTLAATVPRSAAKAASLARDLPLALDSGRWAIDAPAADLTRRERGALRACYGCALARVGALLNDPGLYQRAAEAYKECLAVLTEEETPLDWAMAQKNLGSVLRVVAERAGDRDLLGEAADSLRAALRVLNRHDHAQDWAAAQNRLGEVLYRLEFESGDTEMLKHALGAYQSALQVYTRADAPMQWAEVMNNFAQVTQVLGEELKSPEALEKAADACRAALEVRTKAATPLLWAATQNNLGSALFLLGKMTGNADHLEGAAEAFDLASGVYRARGMERMAAITEKNLGHVNQLMARSRDRDVPPVHWEDAPPEGGGG